MKYFPPYSRGPIQHTTRSPKEIKLEWSNKPHCYNSSLSFSIYPRKQKSFLQHGRAREWRRIEWCQSTRWERENVHSLVSSSSEALGLVGSWAEKRRKFSFYCILQFLCVGRRMTRGRQMGFRSEATEEQKEIYQEGGKKKLSMQFL